LQIPFVVNLEIFTSFYFIERLSFAIQFCTITVSLTASYLIQFAA